MQEVKVYVKKAPYSNTYGTDEGEHIEAEVLGMSGALILRLIGADGEVKRQEGFAPGFWFHYEGRV